MIGTARREREGKLEGAKEMRSLGRVSEGGKKGGRGRGGRGNMSSSLMGHNSVVGIENRAKDEKREKRKTEEPKPWPGLFLKKGKQGQGSKKKEGWREMCQLNRRRFVYEAEGARGDMAGDRGSGYRG